MARPDGQVVPQLVLFLEGVDHELVLVKNQNALGRSAAGSDGQVTPQSVLYHEALDSVINGFGVKDYLRNNLSVTSCRAPADCVRRLVLPHSWVAQATSALSAFNVAKGIKAAVVLSLTTTGNAVTKA